MRPETSNSGSSLIDSHPFTRMQLYVVTRLMSGQRPGEIAAGIHMTPDAIYKRDQRARKRLSAKQRERYLLALQRDRGRRVKLKPISLSFTQA